MHNSISLTNISNYFRFAKELTLYPNNNYMWNAIYNVALNSGRYDGFLFYVII